MIFVIIFLDKATITNAVRGVDATMDAADIIKAVLKKLSR